MMSVVQMSVLTCSLTVCLTVEQLSSYIYTFRECTDDGDVVLVAPVGHQKSDQQEDQQELKQTDWAARLGEAELV